MNPVVTTTKPKKLCLVTFGCQMNKLDSELILGRFAAQGYEFTESYDDASVVLFNTCSVRGHAEDKVYSRVGDVKRLKKDRPDLVLGIVGCMAQREGEDVFGQAPSVDLVCGTREFGRLPELVEEFREGRRRVLAVAETPQVDIERDVRVRPDKHHAFVVVMRGCDMSCSFCIVPTTRGPVQSRPIAEIEAEVRRLAADGVKEITLLGQTVDAYGYDLPGKVRLSSLLYRLADIDGILRISLITLHASYVGEDFIEAMATIPKMKRYLPLPAQSGSERMLKAMNRGYSLDRYREKIAKLREAVPGIEFASDWIVGFPGETDEDFEMSLRTLQEIGYLHGYVFQFSPRPGTVAGESMKDDVPDSVKKERNARLLEAQEESSFQRNQMQIGNTLDVLVEGPHERFAGLWRGRAQANHMVHFSAGAPVAAGELVRVKIEAASPHNVVGRMEVPTTLTAGR